MFTLQFGKVQVRNVELLKQHYNNSYPDILKYIQGGQLALFFNGIDRKDCKDIITSMNKQEASPSEIAERLAEVLGIEIKRLDAESISDELISPRADLKTVLESDSPTRRFPSGTWSSDVSLEIKKNKKIIGEGNNKTVVCISSVNIDAQPEGIVEIQNLDIRRKTTDENGIINILAGKVFFRNIHFENVKVLAAENSDIDFYNCEFTYVPNAIEIRDDAKVYIGDNTKFEKVDIPICIKINDYDYPIRQIEKLRNKSISRESAKVLLQEGELTLSSYLAIFKHLETNGKLLIDEPIEIKGEAFSIESDSEKALVIESPLRSIFLISEGGSLILKNVVLTYRGKAEPKKTAAVLHVTNGSLVMDGCDIWFGGIYGNNASISLKRCLIRNNMAEGIKVIDSKARIIGCNITSNGIDFVGESCSQVAIEKSDLRIEETDIQDSQVRGLYIKESTLDATKCQIVNNVSTGISIIDSSKATIKGCDIRQCGCNIALEVTEYGQLSLKKSELWIEETNISDSKDRSNGLYITESTLEAAKCQIVNNSGQGIRICASSKVRIIGCIIRDNKAGLFDDQIMITGSVVHIENSEIYHPQLTGHCLKVYPGSYVSEKNVVKNKLGQPE
ncbi:MAG: right-handed parallel beta-helix repeat-containing protein [Dissulfurispiraceae bacterium]|jgi:hypothetical protein